MLDLHPSTVGRPTSQSADPVASRPRPSAPACRGHRLRIVVGDPEAVMRDFYRQVLADLGHDAFGVGDGRELVEFCKDWAPDLLLTEAEMPGLDGIEAATEVCRTRPLPVILAASDFVPHVAARAAAGPVQAYLIKPIEPVDLAAAIIMARRRYEQVAALCREVNDLRQSLVDRKVIERAKGILMRKAAVGEEEAYHRLQRLARDTNRRLADVAGAVLTAEQALVPAGVNTV